MAWQLTDDVGTLDTAGGFLAAHAAQDSLLLSIAHSVRDHGRGAFGERPPGYGWWRPADGAEAGLPHRPVHRLLHAELPVCWCPVRLLAEQGCHPG